VSFEKHVLSGGYAVWPRVHSMLPKTDLSGDHAVILYNSLGRMSASKSGLRRCSKRCVAIHFGREREQAKT
jgi:hypothetical protein